VFAKYEKDAQVCASLPLLFDLAGDESHASNPLCSDFISLGQRLEKLGFTYYRGVVTVFADEEY
jgi:hypothetical protein